MLWPQLQTARRLQRIRCAQIALRTDTGSEFHNLTCQLHAPEIRSRKELAEDFQRLLVPCTHGMDMALKP